MPKPKKGDKEREFIRGEKHMQATRMAYAHHAGAHYNNR